MSCHSSASKNAALVELIFQNGLQVFLDLAEGLVIRVAFRLKFLILIEELVDRVTFSEAIGSLLSCDRVHSWHRFELGEALEEFGDDLLITILLTLDRKINIMTSHRTKEGMRIEGLHDVVQPGLGHPPRLIELLLVHILDYLVHILLHLVLYIFVQELK